MWKLQVIYIVYFLFFSTINSQYYPSGFGGGCNGGFNTNDNCSEILYIRSGRNVILSEFPFMAALYDRQLFFCGGSIISPRFIITAAHCTERRIAKNLVALVGANDISQPNESQFTKYIGIRKIINHPYYNSATNENDIALLQSIPIIIINIGVAPICLPFRYFDTIGYTGNVSIAGWGTKKFTGTKSKTLQKARLSITTNANCSRYYQKYGKTIYCSQMCTYDKTGRGRDSCQYDSGGPVVQRYNNILYLVGVISEGEGCGGMGINTRITSFLTWILQSTGNTIVKC